MRFLPVVILLTLVTPCLAFAQTYTITTVAGTGAVGVPGGFGGDGGPAASAQLNQPYGVAVDSAGNLYIADESNDRIRKVSNGVITTVAGKGTPGFSGDNGPATSAQLAGPMGIAVDSTGSLYIADSGNGRIRKVSNGVITTVAGNGTAGFRGDGGPATSAELGQPMWMMGIAVDSAGNLYIADSGNSRVRKVSNGAITTVAGNGILGFGGDNGPATSAELAWPTSVAVDPAGNLYIADAGNNRIRKVSSGVITTVATLGSPVGISVDSALPMGLSVDASGNLYIADIDHSQIRKASKASNGAITTVAGNGTAGFSGDNGPATSAELQHPYGVGVDSAGNIYAADTYNNRVRFLTPTPPTISAVVNAASFRNGPVSPGEVVTLGGIALGPSDPAGLTLDQDGKVSTQVGGVQVLFSGFAAPLTYVSSMQINAVVPYEIQGLLSPVVEVKYQGQTSNGFSLAAAATAPALFTFNGTGTGPAAALNQDYSYNEPNNPAPKGSYLVLYMTGEGQTAPQGVTGGVTIVSATPPLTPQPLLPVAVLIGGQPASVAFYGEAPGLVSGVMQLNLQIPANAPSGNLPIRVSVGGNSSQNGVTVSVQ